jgi:hypothetical protein
VIYKVVVRTGSKVGVAEEEEEEEEEMEEGSFACKIWAR